jgi:hypothetical protein
VLCAICGSFTGCIALQQNSKHGFNDGIYQTKRFSQNKVYILKIDEDTMAVFPVIEFSDSTAIITGKRINYTTLSKKLKDNKNTHGFYRPSFDIDVMTIPVIYRPYTRGFPNQLTANFNGALFAGYRLDEYKLDYKRTPLNVYKLKVKHFGYSIGLFTGMGNTVIDGSTLGNPNFLLEYEGVLLITGLAANIAAGNFTFGISYGPDFLLDKYRNEWIYEGKPCVGFTVGLNLNSPD